MLPMWTISSSRSAAVARPIFLPTTGYLRISFGHVLLKHLIQQDVSAWRFSLSWYFTEDLVVCWRVRIRQLYPQLDLWNSKSLSAKNLDDRSRWGRKLWLTQWRALKAPFWAEKLPSCQSYFMTACAKVNDDEPQRWIQLYQGLPRVSVSSSWRFCWRWSHFGLMLTQY